MATSDDDLDLDAEVAWAELILASEDMRATIAQIDRIPKDSDELDLFYDCVGVITSYARPFKPNNRRRTIGAPFLGALTAEEQELHRKVIHLRDRDHAHSDLYEERVRVKVMHVDVFVRRGADVENLADGDLEISSRRASRGATLQASRLRT
jgi:prephenate dehydrogenase